MNSLIGRSLKVVILRPRLKRMTWPQLVAGAAACKESFEALIAGETEETATVAAAGEMSIADTLAHLALANRSITRRLDALRSGISLDPETPDLWPGSHGRPLAELRAECEESWKGFAESAAQPIVSGKVEPHTFFGPMNAREWVALMAFHHEYHSRKVNRIKRSGAYRKAQGAGW